MTAQPASEKGMVDAIYTALENHCGNIPTPSIHTTRGRDELASLAAKAVTAYLSAAPRALAEQRAVVPVEGLQYNPACPNCGKGYAVCGEWPEGRFYHVTTNGIPVHHVALPPTALTPNKCFECASELTAICLKCNPIAAALSAAASDVGHPHLIGGEFQSDKYPTCPRGKVPLSVKDKTAQDLLWEYAQRRRSVDAEFAADLEIALTNAGYAAPQQTASEKGMDYVSVPRAPTERMLRAMFHANIYPPHQPDGSVNVTEQNIYIYKAALSAAPRALPADDVGLRKRDAEESKLILLGEIARLTAQLATIRAETVAALELWRAEIGKPQFLTVTSGGGKASVEFTYHGDGALKRAQDMHEAICRLVVSLQHAEPK